MTEPYRDYPYLREGDLVAVEINGVLHTEVYKAPKPPVYPRLSAGKRLLRGLTPPWWRKPLQPIREPSPIERAQAMNAKTLELVERLTAEPKAPWWRRWIEELKR